MQKVKNNIGSETTQCGKYRVVPNALNRTSRYNYTDMNVTTKTMLMCIPMQNCNVSA